MDIQVIEPAPAPFDTTYDTVKIRFYDNVPHAVALYKETDKPALLLDYTRYLWSILEQRMLTPAEHYRLVIETQMSKPTMTQVSLYFDDGSTATLPAYLFHTGAPPLSQKTEEIRKMRFWRMGAVTENTLAWNPSLKDWVVLPR